MTIGTMTWLSTLDSLTSKTPIWSIKIPLYDERLKRYNLLNKSDNFLAAILFFLVNDNWYNVLAIKFGFLDLRNPYLEYKNIIVW